MKNKLLPADITSYKHSKKISVLTAYDYSFARLVDAGGVDVILVGDSLGMVLLGEDSTKTVTMDDMIRHTRAVAKGVEHACIVADMPIGSFPTREEALTNAQALRDAGAMAVKIEGEESVVAIVEHLVSHAIPVMGHVGLTPQTADSFKVQGKSATDAARICAAARAVEKAGAFSIVIECVPQQLGAHITQQLSIPTIGIGAGVHTDGQVLVVHDLLGLYGKMRPKFVRQIADMSRPIVAAVSEYVRIVSDGTFPSASESFTMNEDDLPPI